MGWRLFGFGLLEEMQSGRLSIVDLGETRPARAAETVMLDLRRRSDEMLGLVYIGEFVDNQAIPSNQWGLFAMTDYHRFMPGPLRERLKKLK